MLLWFFCSLVSCVSRSPFSEKKTIYGKVSNLDNNPVADAEIYLNGINKTMSDIQGNFVFHGISSKKNTIKVLTRMYEPFEEKFILKHESQFLQISLKEMNDYILKAQEAVLAEDCIRAKDILEEAIVLNPQFQPSYLFLGFLLYQNSEIDALKNLISKSKKAKLRIQDFQVYLPFIKDKLNEKI